MSNGLRSQTSCVRCSVCWSQFLKCHSSRDFFSRVDFRIFIRSLPSIQLSLFTKPVGTQPAQALFMSLWSKTIQWVLICTQAVRSWQFPSCKNKSQKERGKRGKSQQVSTADLRVEPHCSLPGWSVPNKSSMEIRWNTSSFKGRKFHANFTKSEKLPERRFH